MNKQILPNIVDFLHTAVYWHIIGASTDYGHMKAKSQSQSNIWHVDIKGYALSFYKLKILLVGSVCITF